MSGYSKTPLWKKLGYKENFLVLLYNSPDNYLNILGDIPKGVHIKAYTKKELDQDIIHLFSKSTNEVIEFLEIAKNQIKKNGMIWVSWPKKASKIPTDLSDDKVRKIGLDAGLVDVKIAAIDEIWSGQKFVYRLKDR